MAANVTVIVGATEIRFYFGNYTYAEMVGAANMPALTMRLATDQDAICFKNAAGTLFKLLKDASTTDHTPAERVFFADATGQATNDGNLKFDGTDLKVQNCAVHHTGKSSVTITNGGYVAEMYLTSDGKVKWMINGTEQGLVVGDTGE